MKIFNKIKEFFIHKYINHKCIFCDNTINEDLKSGITFNGIKIVAYVGYGSIHDLNKITFYLCDQCITYAKKKNKLISEV